MESGHERFPLGHSHAHAAHISGWILQLTCRTVCSCMSRQLEPARGQFSPPLPPAIASSSGSGIGSKLQCTFLNTKLQFSQQPTG